MEYETARHIMDQLISWISPACSRVEATGALRRRERKIEDLELLAIPRPLHGNPTHYGAPPFKTALEAVLYTLELGDDPDLRLEKIGQQYSVYWISHDLIPDRKIQLRVYLVLPPMEWGPRLLVRTGPATFVHWMITPRSKGGALPDGYMYITMRGQILSNDGETAIPCPEEEDIFSFCQIRYIDPKHRRPHWGNNSLFANGKISRL